MKKPLALVIAVALCAGLCGCASTVSVSGAQIDADGHLILSMSDGSTLDAGLARGEKGEKGDKGEQGIQGLPGEKGEKGDKGDRGPRGEKGERGAQGIQGERGATGYSGGSGASGRDGVDGKTPYIGENGNWWIDGKDTGVYAGNKVEPEPEPDEDTCIVTLNYWYGGSLSEQCNVKKGQTLKTQMEKLPRIDCPSGCYFIGWYIGETPFDINSTIINEDVTVEAKYTSTSYTDEHGFIFLDKDCKKLVGYNGTASEIATPDTTVEIAARAFAKNKYIEKVTVNDGVKVIGDHAFSQCDKLQSVSLPNTISSMGDYAFHNCLLLNNINIPNGITSIGRSAFSSCYKLKTLTLPDGIKEIGEDAFNFSGLTSIVIPDSVTALGTGAFYGTNLTSVTIGKGITSGGASSPYTATIAAGTQITNNGKVIDTVAIAISATVNYRDASGSEIHITMGSTAGWVPEGSIPPGGIVRPIESTAGWVPVGSISNLKKISIINVNDLPTNDSATDTYTAYLAAGTAITNNGKTVGIVQNAGNVTVNYRDASGSQVCVTIGSVAGWVPAASISNIKGHLAITVDNVPIIDTDTNGSITALPDRLFANCSELKTITIGSSITSIGDKAFYDCKKLTTIICEAANPPELGGYILSVNPNLQIKVPANAVEAYKAAPIWSTYAPYITANS